MKRKLALLAIIVAYVTLAAIGVHAISGSAMPVKMTVGITAIGTHWYLKAKRPAVVPFVIAFNAAISLLAWVLVGRPAF